MEPVRPGTGVGVVVIRGACTELREEEPPEPPESMEAPLFKMVLATPPTTGIPDAIFDPMPTIPPSIEPRSPLPE
jgi:hypothetical protein